MRIFSSNSLGGSEIGSWKARPIHHSGADEGSMVGCGGENVSLVVGPSWSYHHFSFVGEILVVGHAVLVKKVPRNSCDLPAVGKEPSPLACLVSGRVRHSCGARSICSWGNPG